jgi:ornithine cyclodeaminase
MLIIDQFQVPVLLPMAECMAVMSDALRALARGEAVQPLRPLLRLPDQSGILGMMPGYLSSPNALGIKVITVFQKNHGTAFDSHQGVILLFEVEHGSVVAIVDASTVTAIRTAAVSGVATAALARADASDLCILGSGVQAETHLEAMLLARRIDRVRVWSRNPENARGFARAASERHRIDVEPMPSARDAVVGADIICTVTSSREPVLEGAWIESGAHVNAVGSSVPSARELDSAAVLRARVFTDRRESALNEAGDLLIPLREGRFHESHIVAELGDVLEGAHTGRESAEEITLFKSLGLAIEDVAAAHRIYANAVRDGIGTQIEIGGRRHAGA